MTGKPFYTFDINLIKSIYPFEFANIIWNELKINIINPIACTISALVNTNNTGLENNHSYALLNIAELTDDNNCSIRLIQLKNPYFNDLFTFLNRIKILKNIKYLND